MKCPKCGVELNRRKSSNYHFTESGLSNVYLGNIYLDYCPHHKEVMVPEISRMQELLAVIFVDVILNPQPLSGEDLRFLRQSNDLTQVELSQLLGVSPNTVARWERGKLCFDAATDLNIRRVILSQADKYILKLLKVRVRQLFSQTTAFSADFKKFRDAVKSDLKYRHPENAIETIPRPLMRKNNPFLVQEETLAPAFV